MTDSPVYLRIDHITKRFGDTVAVNDVSLDIERGEIFALLGSSGCGKSTLLRVLSGFEKPTSGSVWLDGKDVTDLPPYERPMNMMFQSYALFPHLNVWENVAFGLKRDGVAKAEIAQRVEDILQLVQLQKFTQRSPHQLSGGQQQRVALARSLVKRPQLLMLDEPLGALDKKLREETQVELVNIIKKVGVTCVMVTHDQDEAMTMADRIAVMSEGRFLQVGSPGEVYEYPNCRFVAGFVGNVNLLDGEIAQDEVDEAVVHSAVCRFHVGHGISGHLGMPVTVALRPEKIQLSLQDPNQAYNAVACKVDSLSYFGSYTSYQLKMVNGDSLQAWITNTDRHHENIEIGQQLWAHWQDNAMVVLNH
ncbi:MAG: ABC transporter ATP-binding protein [Betaproteobacteria bacterium]|nr:ABC transporter ATP-binding protein [Betaproteobacteria bacterium]